MHVCVCVCVCMLLEVTVDFTTFAKLGPRAQTTIYERKLCRLNGFVQAEGWFRALALALQ